MRRIGPPARFMALGGVGLTAYYLITGVWVMAALCGFTAGYWGIVAWGERRHEAAKR